MRHRFSGTKQGVARRLQIFQLLGCLAGAGADASHERRSDAPRMAFSKGVSNFHKRGRGDIQVAFVAGRVLEQDESAMLQATARTAKPQFLLAGHCAPLSFAWPIFFRIARGPFAPAT